MLSLDAYSLRPSLLTLFFVCFFVLIPKWNLLLPVTYGSVVLRSEVYVSYTRFEIPDTTLNAIVQARKTKTGV